MPDSCPGLHQSWRTSSVQSRMFFPILAYSEMPTVTTFSLSPATTLVEPDEVLIPDARNGVTPSQMVERKPLALLCGGHPGLFSQATRGPGGTWGIRGR